MANEDRTPEQARADAEATLAANQRTYRRVLVFVLPVVVLALVAAFILCAYGMSGNLHP